jgi:glycosyltransferase involved in cell wall biosynthesis
MKIVMDFRKYDGVVGGVEQGVIQLTRYLTRFRHGVTMLCKKKNKKEVTELFKGLSNFKLIALNVDTHVMSEENASLDAGEIQDIAERENADLIHFPYNWSFPETKKRPTVLTLHDVIPFTFREAMDEHTHTHKYKPGITKACRLNDAVATVSEFSKKDIAEKVGAPLDKIHVIYNGLREPNPQDIFLEGELKKRFGLPGRFVLNVGGIHERKNIPRLIKAFGGLVANHDYPGKLVITGKASGAPYQDQMRALCNEAVAACGMGDRVVFTEFITERELDSLFRMADILVYPSLYEGFGIPVLEAMKVGLPVVTSTVSALPEVAGGCAALADPHSVADLTQTMHALLMDEDMRREFKEKGPDQARAFTWERNAERYLELYQKVCKA